MEINIHFRFRSIFFNFISVCCRYRVDTDLILSELAEGSEEDSSVDGRRISITGNVDPSTSPPCHQSSEQNLKQQEEEDTLILQVHFLALSFPPKAGTCKLRVVLNSLPKIPIPKLYSIFLAYLKESRYNVLLCLE